MNHFQIGIIGGGVIGSAIARELARYNLTVAVFEQGGDVAAATSKANSGVIHSGINSPPGSLKARFCVEGNQLLPALANALQIPLKGVGKYVIAQTEQERKTLEELQKVGEKNGVPNLEMHEKTTIANKEPNISCIAGLWVPTAGILLPYQFTIALAENAAANGVRFYLNTKVSNLQSSTKGFHITTSKGTYSSDILINAAGVQCRNIVSMLEEPDFNVYPCRGEYLVLDKKLQPLISSMIYPTPKKNTGVLGVHITPTIEGNILLGPSAEFIANEDDTQNTKTMMHQLLREAQEIIPTIPNTGIISAYAGIRCKLASPEQGGVADYRIEESVQTPRLINLLGIESPGLTAAPAIAQYIVRLISKQLSLKPNPDFNPNRPKRIRFSELPKTEQEQLIKQDPRWGRIICRCEHITEAEVINALSNPLGARQLSSVKYRARAGMGRCQGGFCTQHIVRIMQDEYNMSLKDIKLKSSTSHLFIKKSREEKT